MARWSWRWWEFRWLLVSVAAARLQLWPRLSASVSCSWEWFRDFNSWELTDFYPLQWRPGPRSQSLACWACTFFLGRELRLNQPQGDGTFFTRVHDSGHLFTW